MLFHYLLYLIGAFYTYEFRHNHDFDVYLHQRLKYHFLKNPELHRHIPAAAHALVRLIAQCLT